MDDWAKLDILVRTAETDQRVARACMTLQLYGGPALARQAQAIYRHWMARFPSDAPLHYVNRNAVSPRPLGPKDAHRIEAALARCAADNVYYWINSASGYELGNQTLEIDLWPRNDGVSSAIIICQALQTEISHARAQALMEEFSRIVQIDGLTHASAGLGMGVVWGDDFEQACGQRLFATCMRYLAMDLPNRGIHAYLLQRTKGPGWLTFLSKPLLGELDAPTDAPSGYREIETTHGRILVAGEVPPLGDVNRQAPDILPLRHAAKVVRPLRMTRWIDIPMPIESFDVETDAWLSRLDEAP